MSKVYIVAAKRSAIGSFLGTLSNTTPADFGSQVLKETLIQSKVDTNLIDEVIIGNVLPAGQKQGLARQISLLSGIPKEVPAYSVDMVCGSGMKSVLTAFLNIKSGFSNLVVAGGIESMSQAPFLVSGKTRSGIKMGSFDLVDYMVSDGLTDAFSGEHMGITAETIASMQNITRLEQEEFAYKSQSKAIIAQDNGFFQSEIIPVKIKTKNGIVLFDKDEYINRTTNLEKMANLKPAFKSDGLVTAATSSGLNDGVSFTILASSEMVNKYNLTPLVEIVGIGQAGVEPRLMGLGPIPAIEKSLTYANLEFKDINTFELNESFAAQAIGVINELSKDYNMPKEDLLIKTNPNGGSIALGHPIGASGNRIIVTLTHTMLRETDKNVGLASLCIGGGMGMSIILKRV